MPAVLNKITFRSKHSGLRILRKSAEQQIHPTLGTVMTTSPEVVYEFENGVLEIAPGRDTLSDRFNELTNEWEPRDALEYLRTHPLNGIRFFEIEPIATDPGVIFEALTDAMIAGDLERIHALGDEEFATWNRPEIMERIKSAMDTLEAHNAVKVPPKAKE